MFKKINEWEILTPSGWSDFSGIKYNGKHQLYKLTLENQETITATEDHKFFIKGFPIKVVDILPGNILDSKQGSLSVLKIEKDKIDDVYDIVETAEHKFFIGSLISKNCDEFAFVPVNVADEFYTANYPTISAVDGSIILISTPQGTGNLYYTLWKDAIEGKNNFNPIEVAWDEIPGRDEKWKEKTIKDIGKVKFFQEFACKFVGSTITLIDGDYIVKNLKSEEPNSTPDENTKLWKDPIINHRYLLSIDTAGGVGSDFSVINVFDITYFPDGPVEQVGIWRNNLTTPPKFAEIVEEVAKYWNNAYVIGETNGLSKEVLNRLFEAEYDNLFYDYEDDSYGVCSDKRSKPDACMWFKDYLESGKIILKDTKTIEEIGYFEEASKGVYKAKSGRNLHDDTVITCLWLSYFLKSEFFNDEKEQWNIKKIKNDGQIIKEEIQNVEDDASMEEAYNAFIENDKEKHDNWLEKEERPEKDIFGDNEENSDF